MTFGSSGKRARESIGRAIDPVKITARLQPNIIGLSKYKFYFVVHLKYMRVALNDCSQNRRN